MRSRPSRHDYCPGHGNVVKNGKFAWLFTVMVREVCIREAGMVFVPNIRRELENATIIRTQPKI